MPLDSPRSCLSGCLGRTEDAQRLAQRALEASGSIRSYTGARSSIAAGRYCQPMPDRFDPEDGETRYRQGLGGRRGTWSMRPVLGPLPSRPRKTLFARRQATGSGPSTSPLQQRCIARWTCAFWLESRRSRLMQMSRHDHAVSPVPARKPQTGAVLRRSARRALARDVLEVRQRPCRSAKFCPGAHTRSGAPASAPHRAPSPSPESYTPQAPRREDPHLQGAPSRASASRSPSSSPTSRARWSCSPTATPRRRASSSIPSSSA